MFQSYLLKKVIPVIIMKQTQYSSRKSYLQLNDETLSTRKRNHSLGSNPESQTNRSPTLSTSTRSPCDLVYSSRKNRNLPRLGKAKCLRFLNQNTKLCHQNILQFNLLKRKLTQKISLQQSDQSPKLLPTNPKLSIKNLGLALKNQLIYSNRSMVERRRIQTEPAEGLKHRKGSKDELSPIKLPIFVKKQFQQHSIRLSTKRYNQLTLGEITEIDQIPKFNILVKLQETKQKEVSRGFMKKTIEQFQLQGW